MDLVVAIDIGFKNTGLVIFDCSGGKLELMGLKYITTDHIKKSKKSSVALVDMEKTIFLSREILSYISSCRTRKIVVELPTGGARSSRAVRLMGMASAIIGAISVAANLDAHWTTPREGKIAATGKPDAEKDEMMDSMGKMFPQISGIPKCRREHIADACAAMLAHMNKEKK